MAVDLSGHHLGSCAPCRRQRSKARDSSFMTILLLEQTSFLSSKKCIGSSGHNVWTSFKGDNSTMPNHSLFCGIRLPMSLSILPATQPL